MKDEIIRNLNAVVAALNSVTVCGKPNLANLSGSISILENITNTLLNYELVEADSSEQDIKPQMHKG